MTAAARIKQSDIDRATKAALRGGPGSRVVLDLAAQKIEIVLGDARVAPNPAPEEDWPDDDF